MYNCYQYERTPAIAGCNAPCNGEVLQLIIVPGCCVVHLLQLIELQQELLCLQQADDGAVWGSLSEAACGLVERIDWCKH